MSRMGGRRNVEGVKGRMQRSERRAMRRKMGITAKECTPHSNCCPEAKAMSSSAMVRGSHAMVAGSACQAGGIEMYTGLVLVLQLSGKKSSASRGVTQQRICQIRGGRCAKEGSAGKGWYRKALMPDRTRASGSRDDRLCCNAAVQRCLVWESAVGTEWREARGACNMPRRGG